MTEWTLHADTQTQTPNLALVELHASLRSAWPDPQRICPFIVTVIIPPFKTHHLFPLSHDTVFTLCINAFQTSAKSNVSL